MQVPKRRSEQNRRRDTGVFYVTPEAMESMKRTITSLEGEVPQRIKDVEHAKEHGDFSENAEYQHAKYILRRTYGRIARIKDKLLRAEVIDRRMDPLGRIILGSTVVVETSGKKQTYTILGPHETDPSRGRISHVSPLGMLLLGKQQGDDVTLTTASGTRAMRIVEVR